MIKFIFPMIATIYIFMSPGIVNPATEDLNINIGIEYVERWKFQKAIDFFQTAIEYGQKNESTYFYLAEAIRLKVFFAGYNALSENKRIELLKRAESAYICSLNLKPSFFDSKIGLGKLYRMQGEYNKALNILKETEAAGHRKPDLYIEIGNCYLEQNNLELAIEYFIKAGVKERAGFEKEKKSTLIIDDEYLIDGIKIVTQSTVDWKISDSIIFMAKLGSMKIAGSRIHDIYYAALLIGFPIDGRGITSIEEINKDQIRKRCNSRLKLFGIQIIRINEIKFRT
jgi:tetratricopeptide (TPR) repeat protein